MGKLERPAHSDRGLNALLARQWVYRFSTYVLGGARAGHRLVQDYIKPFEGCRILDLGCGPEADAVC